MSAYLVPGNIGFSMSARRIARELAVIVLPQLPKDKQKLENIELNQLVHKSSQMLTDYAKQCLADADAMLTAAGQQLLEIEADHPQNVEQTDELLPVPLTSGQVKEQLNLVERALHLVSEALDVPEIALEAGGQTLKLTCKKCSYVNQHTVETADHADVQTFLQLLVGTYAEHRQEIDQFIARVKAKWKVERMVSIDRDILRLACTEAFFMRDIPLAVCINEAVELAHRFADTQAARFINGVLRDLALEAEHYRKTGTFLETETTSSSAG